MDEKGFLIGILARSKCVFSKAKWKCKKVTKVLQNGSCKWTMVIAYICTDGTLLEPAIIYERKSRLQSA
jgi:hypothetical protein